MSADDPLADLWWNLLEAQRRALCELAYLDPHVADVYIWAELPVDARVRLVRAMRLLSELSMDCAHALEHTRSALA